MEKALNPAPKDSRLSPGQRVYVVGDVHGHRDRLAGVHDRIRADLHKRPVPSPLLVHVGDLIDRGPDSAGCVALLAAGPPIRGVPTVNLMGNHESMLLTALNRNRQEDSDRWLDNGGAEALASWGLKSSTRPADWLAGIPPSHLILLRDLRLKYALGGYVFVHAGVRPGVRLDKQKRSDLLWIRESFLDWDGTMLPEAPERVIVHGHTIVDAPVLKANRIGLDTGAGKGGPLTCAVLEGDRVGLFQT